MPGQVLLSLGSNAGERREALRAAVRRIAQLPDTRLRACSCYYETEPVGVRDQASFLNAAVAVETAFEPLEFLAALKEIEAALGRCPGQRWGPRRIDIDVILWEDVMFEDEVLTLPHAAFRERAFVLRPLSEIAPDAVDPVTGRCVAELASAPEARGRVERREALTP